MRRCPLIIFRPVVYSAATELIQDACEGLVVHYVNTCKYYESQNSKNI